MKTAIILIAAIIQLSQSASEPDVSSLLSTISDLTLSEDGKRNFTQLVTKFGHKSEQFTVQTEDGYLLSVYHIPGKKSSVLLAHGLTTDCDTYILRGHDSLGIALADAGYDVWFLNNRGTKYGRRHVNLDPDKDKKFWDYSFNEMGYYDLPAMIDFILDKTGKKKIVIIGHSQGGSQTLALMSMRPEYNDKVKLFVGLAPTAYFMNMPPLFRLIADAGPVLANLAQVAGIEEIFRDRSALLDLIKILCTKGVLSYAVCVKAIIFPFVGYNSDGIEVEFLPTLLGHAPSGISRKCLVHYDQLYLRKKFSQYDNGAILNLAKYGSVSPPDYDLSKVTLDTVLMPGVLDLQVLPENVKRLRKELPNVVHYETILKTTHFDFVIGREAPKYLFPAVFKILKKYDLFGTR